MRKFLLPLHSYFLKYIFLRIPAGKNLGFMILFLCISVLAFAQRISGTVMDNEGKPLQGATITVKNSSALTTTTNSAGHFSLDNVISSGSIEVSYVGFISQIVQFNSGESLKIVMQYDQSALKGVVVVGYGTQSKALVTTAISKIDTNVLKNVPYSNAAQALQGTLPGVRVTTTSGLPGSAPIIVVRGGTALDPNISYPLYIVNGVIVPDLTGINPSDIESIQVLKDAASTAIYGARGSNGVVIVTTKKGSTGKTSITYHYDLGFSNYDYRMKMLDAHDFIYYNRLALRAAAVKFPFFAPVLASASSAGTGNDLTNKTFYTTQYLTPDNQHKLSEGWSSMPDPLDPSKTIIYKGTDWRDVMLRTAVSHNHNISASGGSERATYYLSLGYLSNSGVAINTGYRRLSFSTRGDLKINDVLRVYGDIQFSSGKTEGVSSEANIFGRMFQVAPTVKYRFEDGTLAQGPNGNKGNPEYRESIIDGASTNSRAVYSLGAKWDIRRSLSFSPRVSLLTRGIDTWQFIKANYDGLNYDQTRSASQSNAKYSAYQADAVLNYSTSFNNVHNIDATGGFSYLRTEDGRLSASGRGAATDLIPTLNASAVPVGVSSTREYYAYAGYFARLNYNFNQKYLLSINARYDGSSNLGANYRWGFFPGVSAGWIINKEEFFSGLSNVFSQFKIRGSYGVNGNVNAIGAYQAQGVYGVGNIYNGNSAVINTVLANPELKWEQAKTFDIGLDLGFLKNRVSFSGDYYRKVTDNLIASRTLPQETGFGSILTNLGSVENKGVELALDVQVIKSTKLQWTMSTNAAFVKNKILKLPPNGIANNRIGGIYVYDASAKTYMWKGGLQEGGTMGDLYGYKQIGLYQSDAEAAAGPIDMLVEGADKKKFGGDVDWLDVDNNDTIDTRDQIYMGNIYPKWTGGLISNLSYKNFYLVIRLDFMVGQTIYNYMRATTTGQFAGDLGLSADAGRSWLKPGDKTEIPRLYYGDYQSNLLRGSSIMFEKGNYASLREVTLSYELPAKLIRRMHITGLRFNLTGHNLHYFTNYKGINPENGGTENGTYPISSNYIVGATLSF